MLKIAPFTFENKPDERAEQVLTDVFFNGLDAYRRSVVRDLGFIMRIRAAISEDIIEHRLSKIYNPPCQLERLADRQHGFLQHMRSAIGLTEKEEKILRSRFPNL